MDELIAWLRQQLDEDLDAARVAAALTRSPWTSEGPTVTCADGFPVVSHGDGEAATAHHIARWDPARVLAEVETKRRILDLHAPAADYKDRVQCGYCASLCHSRSGLGCDEPADAMYPCETVSLLAQAYAEQPGWREEWRS